MRRRLVDGFPNQPLDFFGAARAKVYDDAIHEWMCEADARARCEFLVRRMRLGVEDDVFGNVGADSSRWHYHTPGDVVRAAKVSSESVFKAASELAEQQQYLMTTKLSTEYMKWQKNPEDLTDEEREAMEAKDSWRKTMKKREEERRARVAEMRTTKASPGALEARRLLIEASMRRAREKRERDIAERGEALPADAGEGVDAANTSTSAEALDHRDGGGGVRCLQTGRMCRRGRARRALISARVSRDRPTCRSLTSTDVRSRTHARRTRVGF